jgi:hypothetical protein
MTAGSDALGFREECLLLQLKCNLLVGGQDHAYSFRNAREDAVQRLQRYRDNVQQRSRIMRDQPSTPVDSGIYWIEHVIRHKGAPHLRSTSLDLKWYHREMIDIITILVTIVTVFLIIFFLLLKKMFTKCDNISKKIKNCIVINKKNN